MILQLFRRKQSGGKRTKPTLHRLLRAEGLEAKHLLDAAGPHVVSHSPAEVRNDVFDHIDLVFSEAISAASFTIDDVVIDGPSGPVTPTSVEPLAAETFRVNFPALTVRGIYRATIGSGVLDVDGNPMNQNGDAVNGEPNADQYIASFRFIDATTIFTTATTITESDTTYDGQDIAVDGTTVTINGPHRFNSVHIINGATVTHSANTMSATHKLDIVVAEQVIVDATSKIDVTGKGYLPGRTKGNLTTGAATGQGAGSFGGLGGAKFYTTNSAYGNYDDPDDWGSGGGSLAGGGLVQIEATTFSLNGQLLANGVGGSDGAGSGGGISISVANLTGSGRIDASGGNVSGRNGGGGGRIAVLFEDMSGFSIDSITAYGGNASYSDSNPGAAGTVWLENANEPSGTLIVANNPEGMGVLTSTPLGSPTQAMLAISHAIIIRGARTFVRIEPKDFVYSLPLTVDGATLAGRRIVAPELAVINGGVVTALVPSASQVHKLELDIAGTLSVSATSKIDVTAKGYLRRRTTGNTTSGGATGDGGGSYGGLGGVPSGSTTNATYGDFADPDDWGSGGARGDVFGDDLTGAGGGLVRITSETLVLNGRLLANGINGSSGGGIFVSVAALIGDGSIQAAGGAGSYAETGTGGGGGRIAVYSRDFTTFPIANITASGGVGRPSGGPGTVHRILGYPRAHVRRHAPAGVNGGYVSQAITGIDLHFNKPIDLQTFLPSEIIIDGQMGRIMPTTVTLNGDRVYHVEFPFALSANGQYRFTLPAHIVDAEGLLFDQNANGILGELEDIYSFDLFVDTVAPRAVAHTPNGDVAGTISQIDVWVSEQIDRTTFTTSDIQIVRPGGTTVAATGVQEIGLNRFRVSFPAQTLTGTYRVRIGPDVRDLAGNRLDQDRDGTFGEADDDVYEAAFHLVEVDLGLTNLMVNAAELVAGETVTVSWSGSNQTGAELFGSWIDGVYLSADDRWDIGDERLALVTHTGGLAQNAEYSSSAEVLIPGRLPGNYHVIVRADVANQEREAGDGEADNLVELPIPLRVRTLDTAVASTGTLTPADRAEYFAIHVPDGETLGLVLDGQAATGSNELYVGFESIPTRSTYSSAALYDERRVNQQDRQLAVNAPASGGTYYLLVYADAVDVETPYALEAQVGEIVVTSITPDRASNLPPNSVTGYGAPIGRVVPSTVTIMGAGFTDQTTIEFIAGDGTIRLPESVNRLSNNQITANLDLPSWSADSYDVRIARGESQVTLVNGFTVVQGGTPKLETNLILPARLGFSIPIRQTIWIEYANTGDAPMPAPLLALRGSHEARITTDISLATPYRGFVSPLGVSDTVQIMGTGSDATPGILQPGDARRIPVYYIGLGEPASYPQVTFTLGALTADNVSWQKCETAPVTRRRPNGTYEIIGYSTSCHGEDWTLGWYGPGITHEGTLREDMRPESMPADAWAAIWANLSAQIGSEWGDYVVAMADNVDYLGRFGQTTSDVSDLWNFEIAQASAAISPVRYLTAAVDASRSAPGLPLAFARVYGQSIPSRFRLGPLGRGWTHNWEIKAEIQSNGDVVLRGPGGSDRFFTRQRNGSYTSAPGDYGRLLQMAGAFRLTETDQLVWQFDAGGLLRFAEDANHNRITLAYDDGQLTSLTHSSGGQLLIDYDANGRIWHVTDPAGPEPTDDLVTTFEYDGDHLVRVTAPSDRVTQYAYEDPLVPGGLPVQRQHALRSVTNPGGTSEHFAYFDDGRLKETFRGSGVERVTFAYDSAGGVMVTDATGRRTQLFFGIGGQLAQVRDGEGNVVALQYDNRLQLTSLLGPLGEQYRYSYDSRGNLSSIFDPLRNTTFFTYDPTFNQLTGFTDARGNGIDYGYDGQGNLRSTTYEDQSEEAYTYYSSGLVETWTNRRGQTIRYTYNDAGQLTSKDDLTTAGVDFTYSYDAFGNLLSATDAQGTTTLTPDLVTGLLRRIDYPGGLLWLEFDYNDAGQRTRRTDQDGNVTVYEYDALGRLDRLTDGTGGLIVDYDYDSAGRFELKTLGNGVYTTYDYDAAGRVLHLVNFKPDASVLSRYDYTYDASGRRTSMTTLGGTQFYGYDAIGQLTSVGYMPASIPAISSVQYEYDAAGNRIRIVDEAIAHTTTEYMTNDLNQYTQVGDATFTYDTDGNMTSKTEGGVTTTYIYNAENRLIEVRTPNDTWVYRYDAFGIRIGTTHNGVATQYVVDPIGLGNVAAEYADGSLVARYEHGFGLIGRLDANGNPAYYTFQAIGNTSELTDATGNVLNSYSYDPFGTMFSVSETVDNPFKFVGEYGVIEEGTGLTFMRARFYDENLGVFVSADPLHPTAIDGNLYRYASGNPVARIDPQGLLSWSEWKDVIDKVGLIGDAGTAAEESQCWPEAIGRFAGGSFVGGYGAVYVGTWGGSLDFIWAGATGVP